ncbi:MAG TPA: prolyl oligopeptidase family serine peptidase, partial [Candidatus Acidoferrum sp.]|nr:prolyl oligopeptidase family serine peptidase [Candidatus Acidoferrum sp.]
MIRLTSLLRVTIAIPALAAAALSLAAQQIPALRTFQPQDLFRVRKVGAVAWSPDGRHAAIELSSPGRTLDSSIPTSEIQLLDVKTRTLRTLSSPGTQYLGFFNAVWSPSGKRLAFLSVDSNAVVQMWTWRVGAAAPVPVRDYDLRFAFGDPSVAWISDDRIAIVAWDVGAEKDGELYFRILKGRNVADKWKQAFSAQSPSVAILDSGGPAAVAPPSVRIIAIDLNTNIPTTLARGRLHRLALSEDQHFITFNRENPGLPGQSVASYIGLADAEQGYAAVNWGTERHVIDARSGKEVDPSLFPAQTSKPIPKDASTQAPPRPDARKLAASPDGDASLYLANASDGTHLLICGGGNRPASSCAEIWHANEWMQQIKAGKAESFSYTALDGTPLTAWLLLPPDYSPGTRLPVVTIVYPTSMFGAAPPWNFSLFQNDFEHPQLFAAMGYVVLMPSMPPAKDPADAHALALLPNGVLPAVDALIARGIADPDRIAVVGQSNGGFATLGLITQSNRFRSAIASAGFSDLVSLYGTFYGQYRYGDAGPPQKGQVFRMLQVEKGDETMGGPPWAQLDRYRTNSSVLSADKVQTPL